MAEFSKTWTHVDCGWLEGNPGLIGPRSHAFWQASIVFDGARAFEGVMPDLDLHCARVNRSAVALGLEPTMRPGEIADLAREGVAKFPSGSELYIRPMYWAEASLPGSAVALDPGSTRFCLSIYEAPMPKGTGAAITLSPFRRPSLETMPTDAKAACLYPNGARALKEAKDRGFDNALMCDMLGNVAELATANIFMAKDGVLMTPAPNGSFLDGITRRRVIALFRERGREVVETVLSPKAFLDADEIFQVGNYGKVQPISRIEGRALQPGPFYRDARELYWGFAHA